MAQFGTRSFLHPGTLPLPGNAMLQGAECLLDREKNEGAFVRSEKFMLCDVAYEPPQKLVVSSIPVGRTQLKKEFIDSFVT